MIQVCFISSIVDLPVVQQKGHLDLGLAHLLLESPAYANYFRGVCSTDRFTILDNSIMELGEAMAGDEVLALAKEFKPKVVIAPDCFNNRKETIARTVDFIRRKKRMLEIARVQVMAVAHGNDWGKWMECFESHQRNDAVSIIGLPYGTTFQIPGITYSNLGSKTAIMMDNRLWMSNWISKKFRQKAKPCHLLGASDPKELIEQKKHDFVISHDSSSAYACGMNGVVLDPIRGLGGIEKFKMDFKWKANEEQMVKIKQNISIILGMVTHGRKTQVA